VALHSDKAVRSTRAREVKNTGSGGHNTDSNYFLEIMELQREHSTVSSMECESDKSTLVTTNSEN
jgi:hypothetical protein